MHRSSKIIVTAILILCMTALQTKGIVHGKGSADVLTAPPLDRAVPKALDMTNDLKPPKDGRRESIGFRRTAVVALKAQQGIYPICIVEAQKGIIANDPFEVNDVIIAVNGKPLAKNPALQFRQAHDQAKKDSGVLWVTLWRKGVIARCMIDLGTHPLDLTKGAIAGGTRDWRLGPIGANGWCYHRTTNKGASALARQIAITAVDKDGPAAGKLEVGDVILGTNGKKFDTDARKVIAAAINEAEKAKNYGKLKLVVWRKGRELEVVLRLPVMGSYSKTAPFDCDKTDKIIDNAVKYIKKNKDDLLKPGGWITYLNGLGLLATGRQDVMPMVRDLAHGSILKDGETLSVEKHVSMQCWWWSYKTVFMCEYYLRTKDRTVLPTINEYATKIAMGQSGVGTWGHTYAARENTGYLHGHLGGYGAINQQGLTLMIALTLSEKCGIKNKEVMDAIKRGDDFFSYFIGRGTIPYGDHGAAKEWFDDNGKSGAAAIFFDLMENPEGARFFSDMVLGSAPSGRETGHTGHFWSHLWGGMGAGRGGEKSLQVFMDVMNPYFTLERQANGRFAFQGNAGENGKHGDPKTKWDCTGTRLLQLCVPRRATYITGKTTPGYTHLSQKRIDQLLRAGRLDVDKQAREKLTVQEIFELLEDPLPPTRSIGARTLAERDINCVDKLILMLDSKNKYARYGAAEALCKAGYASKAAADKLIRVMATDKDITFQSYAMEALINRDTRRGLLNVAKPAIPVLLRMAVTPSPDDPRKVLQQQISLALFYNGNAQPRTGLLKKYGLDGVDRSMLISAIKDILTNDNGGTRSLCSWVFDELTKDELNQLWPDLYKATNCAPSGVMFAAQIRQTAVRLMAENRIKEGLPVIVKLIRNSRYHSDPRIPNLLPLLPHYGAHAKKYIPQLQDALTYYKTAKRGDAAKIVQSISEAIEKIKAQKEPADFELVSISKQIGKARRTPSKG